MVSFFTFHNFLFIRKNYAILPVNRGYYIDYTVYHHVYVCMHIMYVGAGYVPALCAAYAIVIWVPD